MLCTNTMHKLAAEIELAITIPFVHIADTTADAVRAAGLERVGLLATGYTMEQDFYVGRLRSEHGLDVLVPDGGRPPDRPRRDLRGALRRGRARRLARRVPADHARAGRPRAPQGILLGCTEIDLLVGPRGLAGAGLRHHPAARRARGYAGAGAVTAFGRGRRLCGIDSAHSIASTAAIAATMNASV